jgi:hypothetical protein
MGLVGRFSVFALYHQVEVRDVAAAPAQWES